MQLQLCLRRMYFEIHLLTCRIYIYSDHVDVCHPHELKKKKKVGGEDKGDSTTLQLLKILCTLWGSYSWM